jgi:copper chaperone CopZ
MEGKKYVYEFFVGMTCDGCSNAIKKLLSSEAYIETFEISVADKSVKVIANGDGIEQRVIDRLTKWANASKKELEFKTKTEIAA